MKRAFGLLVVTFALSLLSCQDTPDDVHRTPDLSAFKNVGMKIPTETAARWIQLYNESNNVSGRDGSSFYVNKTDLQRSLGSVSGVIGVAFQYGVDATGNTHVIMIPVDASFQRWNALPGRLYIDANTSEEISQATAQSWANNFQSANPDAVWAHYFGSNIFDNILSTTDIATVDIVPATSDLDFSPQLLLITGSTDGLLGRTTTETAVYDASYPCPKCPVN